MVTDVRRRRLFDALVRELGEDSAETLMELLPPMDWSELARRAEMAAMDGRLTAELGGLRGEMGGLRGEMAELRGEVRALGARLDAQFAKLVTANLATSAALAAMIGVAVRLFGG